MTRRCIEILASGDRCGRHIAVGRYCWQHQAGAAPVKPAINLVGFGSFTSTERRPAAKKAAAAKRGATSKKAAPAKSIALKAGVASKKAPAKKAATAKVVTPKKRVAPKKAA